MACYAMKEAMRYWPTPELKRITYVSKTKLMRRPAREKIKLLRKRKRRGYQSPKYPSARMRAESKQLRYVISRWKEVENRYIHLLSPLHKNFDYGISYL